DRAVDVRENLEFIRDPEIVSIGRDAVGDRPLAHLFLLERLDHSVLAAHAANPLVALDHARPHPPGDSQLPFPRLGRIVPWRARWGPWRIGWAGEGGDVGAAELAEDLFEPLRERFDGEGLVHESSHAFI